MADSLTRDSLTKLVSITIPEDWWEAAARLARDRGLNRSELMRALLWDALPQKTRSKLSQPTPQGRQSLKAKP